MNEEAIIERLREIFATSSADVQVGIGDDAAIVRTRLHTAITTDMAVEGNHFKVEWSSAREIGGRVAIANLADIYAMGATPTFLVVAISLTGNESLHWIEELAEGIAAEARTAGAVVVGGDIVKGNQLTISITALGSVETAVTLDGASIGDGIYLSALPGYSRGGLEQLVRGVEYNRHAISQYKKPSFDFELARAFGSATSMRDISDAFLIQASSMTKKYGFAIEPELIEAAEGFGELDELARSLGFDVWELILGGGEDHVLLATGKDLPGIRIGRVVEGQGILGLEKKKAPETWRHF